MYYNMQSKGVIMARGGFSSGGVVEKFLRVEIPIVAATTEQDTGVDLPSRAIVLGVYLDVKTLEATGGTTTMDVGLLSSESGGDADGFFDAIDAGTPAGLKVPALTNSAATRGLLLRDNEDGAGAWVPAPFGTDAVTAKSITYTLGANDWVEFVGAVVFHLLEVVEP